jgi:hypothetical protein
MSSALRMLGGIENPLDLSEMEKMRFLQRVKQLQNLCSSGNPNFPDALLFVPGQDGRNNKGSQIILKYLFQLSVGKELFEGSLDERLESLEESVILIQENTLSIVLRYLYPANFLQWV